MWNMFHTDTSKKNKKTPWVSSTLESLFEGVFLNQEEAYKYASFFYKA
jgi:hypothetical protein